jgi:hypothetical protein
MVYGGRHEVSATVGNFEPAEAQPNILRDETRRRNLLSKRFGLTYPSLPCGAVETMLSNVWLVG